MAVPEEPFPKPVVSPIPRPVKDPVGVAAAIFKLPPKYEFPLTI